MLAAQAPADAQDAIAGPWHTTIGVGDDLDQPIGPAVTGVGQGQTGNLDTPIEPAVTGVGQDAAEEGERQGLGGMGDEEPLPPGVSPLGGLGDEPGEGEAAVVAEPEIGPGLTVPTSAISEAPQIHSALNPEPHDLDPFVPIGIRIGSFLIFPEAEVGVDMTNNVLATRNDARFDAGPEVTPKVRIDSDWNRHFLSFEANADRIWYSEFPIADVKNYQFLLKGRADVTRRTRLFGEIEKSHVQEGPSSIAITDIAGANEILDEEHATAAVEHTFNRLTLKLTGTVADYNYSEGTADPTLDGPVPFADIRDYREVVGTLRSTYEFQSRWAGFIETSVNERDYHEPVDVTGFKRGSSGYTALAGVNLRLAGGTLFGEIAGGWGEQQPIDSSFETISGPLVNGDLIWMPGPSTKLEFIARSEIEETTLEEASGAIDHFFSLSLEQALWRFLVLGAYASYEVADFVGTDQLDQRTKLGATAEYYFNPVVSAYARYEHTDFTSTDSSSDFVEDEVKIGLKFRR
jgi:hypothetical protein